MMMKKPLIGLTTYGRDEKNAFSLPAQYLESVRRAGAVPFLIAPDETELDEILPMLSGLILTGGGDMNPESYHGDSLETIYMIDDERDQAEINIFNRFYETGRPILGICRGDADHQRGLGRGSDCPSSGPVWGNCASSCSPQGPNASQGQIGS